MSGDYGVVGVDSKYSPKNWGVSVTSIDGVGYCYRHDTGELLLLDDYLQMKHCEKQLSWLDHGMTLKLFLAVALRKCLQYHVKVHQYLSKRTHLHRFHRQLNNGENDVKSFCSNKDDLLYPHQKDVPYDKYKGASRRKSTITGRNQQIQISKLKFGILDFDIV